MRRAFAVISCLLLVGAALAAAVLWPGSSSAAATHEASASGARHDGSRLIARSRVKRLQVTAGARGVLVRAGAERVELSLVGVRRAGRLLPAAVIRATTSANRITLDRGNVREWYVNGAYGLEQGFTIAHRPLPAVRARLELALRLSGNVRATSAGPGALTLRGPYGSALRYSGLSVADAHGRTLRASLAARDLGIDIYVDDAGATYPLRIDPYIQQAKLTGPSGQTLDGQVAISGNTIAIGDTGTQSVLVYQRSAAAWSNSSTPTAVLKAPALALAAGELFPTSVAIAGNTIVVGARNNVGSGPGHAYVFVEPGGGWSTTSVASETLSEPLPHTSIDYFGFSVAISSDAGTIAVGAPNYAGHGAGFVFAKPFTGSPAELDSGTPSGIGESVATTGSTTVVAGNNPDAFVFVEPSAGWAPTNAPTGTLSTDAGPQPFSGFGATVSMTPSTIVIADPIHGSNGNLHGSVYVYVQHGGRFVSEIEDATLSASDGATFGGSSSVSISGNTIAAGAPSESVNGNGQQGEVFLFSKGPGNWTSGTQTGTAVASDGGSCDHLGWSTAISDGQLAASNQTGNCHSSNGPGAVYVFGSVPTTSIAVTPAAPNGRGGWYVSPVDVAVSAVDDAGLAATRCELDPASAPASFAAIAAACPFAGGGSPVSGDGQHIVYAGSLGVLGTTATPVSASFKIDTTPPTVTCSPPLSFTLHGNGGLVAATVTDATSGAVQATVAAPADVSTAGNKTVALTGFDNAGNSTTVQCPYMVVTPRISARLSWGSTEFSAFTVLTELIVAQAPSGAQIAIHCAGHGCTPAHHSVRVATTRLVCNRHHKHCKREPAPPLSNVDILSPLRGRHLAVGTKLTVTLTKQQMVGEVWTLKIRSARAPLETGPTCLAPGSAKPGTGC